MADDEDEEEVDEDEDVEEVVEESDEEMPAEDPNSKILMAYQKPTTSYTRMNGTVMGERRELDAVKAQMNKSNCSMLDKSGDPVNNLKRLLKAKFGSLTRGWREGLDVRNVHHVGKADFIKGVKNLGFPGDPAECWNNLGGGADQARGQRLVNMDGQVGRHITLADFDVNAAQVIGDFYRIYVENVGRLPGLVDSSESLRLGKESFIKRCEVLKRDVNLEKTFNQLNTNGTVSGADCLWLEHYVERSTAVGSTSPPDCIASTVINDSLARFQTGDRVEALREKASRRALEDFRTLLQHRYGGILAAWRKELDPTGQGHITGDQLAKTAAKIGFKGEIADVWSELTNHGGYTASIEDLDKTLMSITDAFKKACEDRFGGMVKTFKEFRARRKPLVTKDEFRKLCVEINMDKNFSVLWGYLDSRNVGAFVLTSIDSEAAMKVFGADAVQKARVAYEAMEQRPGSPSRMTLKQRFSKEAASTKTDYEQAGIQEFADFLVKKYGSHTRGWTAIDPEGKGKLSKGDFKSGASVAGFCGSTDTIWKEARLHDNHQIKLKDVAPDTIRMVGLFKKDSLKQMRDRKGFIVEDKGTRRIEKDEFIRLAVRADTKPEHAGPIFEALDLAGQGAVMVETLRWLYDSKSEDKCVPSILHKQADLRRTTWSAALKTRCLEPKSDLLKQQDEKIQASREKREARGQTIKKIEDFKAFLTKKFGGLSRAWQLGLDPDRDGELDKESFVSALKRIGFVDEKRDTDDKEKEKEVTEELERLYAQLVDEETGTLMLSVLDPITAAMMSDFKRRCVIRFGGLAIAFQEFDPTGEGQMSVKRFKFACHEIGLTNGQLRLIQYLDPEGQNEIKFEDIDEDAAIAAEELAQEAVEKTARKVKQDEDGKRTHMVGEKDNSSIQVSVGVEARREERHLQVGQNVVDALKTKLQHKYGTLVKGWRKVFDQKFVDMDGFKEVCEQFKIKIPKSNEDESEDTEDTSFHIVWRALLLNPDENESLTLEQFDPGLYMDLQDFKQKLTERYGSAEAAFMAIDAAGTGKLDKKGWMGFCSELQLTGNERRVFAYFDKNDTGTVSLKDINKRAFDKLKRFRKQRKKEIAASKKDPTNPQEVIAEGFKQFAVKKFGNLVRAWKAIDKQGLASMTKREFCAAIAVTGYAASPTLLFEALLATTTSPLDEAEENEYFNGTAEDDAEKKVKSHLSLKDVLDEDSFSTLGAFYNSVQASKFGKLKKAFVEKQDKAGTASKILDEAAFYDLCRQVEADAPWEPLWGMLASVRNTVGWEEARFLDEQWNWVTEEPKRRRPPSDTRPSGRPVGCPERVTGEGPQATNMRPLKVVLAKSTSLPNLSPPLRALWNDRHEVKDTLDNKLDNMIHSLAYVQTQDQERIKKRVKQKVIEVPTHEWMERFKERNMPKATS